MSISPNKKEILEIKEEVIEWERSLSKELEALVFHKRKVKIELKAPLNVKKKLNDVIDDLKLRIVQILHELSEFRTNGVQKYSLYKINNLKDQYSETFESTMKQIKRLLKAIKNAEENSQNPPPRYATTTFNHEIRKTNQKNLANEINNNKDKVRTSSKTKKQEQKQIKRQRSVVKNESARESFQQQRSITPDINDFYESQEEVDERTNSRIDQALSEEFEQLKNYIESLRERVAVHRHQDYGTFLFQKKKLFSLSKKMKAQKESTQLSKTITQNFERQFMA